MCVVSVLREFVVFWGWESWLSESCRLWVWSAHGVVVMVLARFLINLLGILFFLINTLGHSFCPHLKVINIRIPDCYACLLAGHKMASQRLVHQFYLDSAVCISVMQRPGVMLLKIFLSNKSPLWKSSTSIEL
jgi:hypothetical protein